MRPSISVLSMVAMGAAIGGNRPVIDPVSRPFGRKALKSGTARCGGCGKTISANKDYCFACVRGDGAIR